MDMMEQMVDFIQQDLEDKTYGISVEYRDEGRYGEFVFDGNKVRIVAVPVIVGDVFSFTGVYFDDGEYGNAFGVNGMNEALFEIETIFQVIKDNDGVTVLTEEE